MSYGAYLKELLRPMGAYRLEDSINGAELESIGGTLDGQAAVLEELEREMCPATAEDWGLERLERLLARRPLAVGTQARRAALRALLRISGDSFTLAAMNETLAGCGINAAVSETGTPGKVEVRFPDVPGVPDGFEKLRKIIEDILPCHVEIIYVYWYVTWVMLEGKFATWGALENRALTWEGIEKLVK